MARETEEEEEPRVLVGETGISRPIPSNKAVTIGSSNAATLFIPHPSIASLHCEFRQIEGGQVQVRRLSPDHDLLVNAQVVEESRSLAHEDTITVGLFRLRFEDERASVAAPKEVVQDETRSPAETDPYTILQDDQRILEIVVEMESEVLIGSRKDADLQLPHADIAPQQMRLCRSDRGLEAEDLAETGTLLNARPFDQRTLTIGDLLQLGKLLFVYDGFALRPAHKTQGCRLEAQGVAVTAPTGKQILHHANFLARPGQFIGILGPSGAGKTTFLRALSGVQETSSGSITLDGKTLADIEHLSDFLGFVPQEDIVHLELSAREALRFSALLRLPGRTPLEEIEKLVLSIAGRLGLLEHLDTKPAHVLSGGQKKRLSVGVELLNRPSLLFLDEPTSGLDPEAETELMQQLLELSKLNCTIICTTHVMENVFLMDSIAVLMAGRDPESGQAIPGTTIFQGKPRAAKNLFGVRDLAALYSKLRSVSQQEWLQRAKEFAEAKAHTAEHATQTKRPAPPSNALPQRFALPVLLWRQWAIMQSQPNRFLLLFGQPLLIALLICVVTAGMDSWSIRLFFAYIVVLWLGCGNLSAEIVGELPVLRREHVSGLPAWSYLLAKFVAFALISTIQASLIFLVIRYVLPEEAPGSTVWQLSCLVLCGFCGTAIGLAVSAGSQNALQATLLVPIVIIPQILFSGYVVRMEYWIPKDRNEVGEPLPRLLCRVMPGFYAQRLMDISLVWERESNAVLPVDSAHVFQNLDRWRFEGYQKYEWQTFESGRLTFLSFRDPSPGREATIALSLWILGPALFAWSSLLRRLQRGT